MKTTAAVPSRMMEQGNSPQTRGTSPPDLQPPDTADKDDQIIIDLSKDGQTPDSGDDAAAPPEGDETDGHVQEQIEYVSPRDLAPSPFDDIVNPPATDDEILALKQSIQEFGVQNAIVVWGNSGKSKFPILAGTRRHAIALEIGLETVPVVFRNFDSKEEAKQFALRENLERRELKTITRAMMADELWRIFDKAGDKKAKAAEGLPPRKRAALAACIAEGSLAAYRFVLDTEDVERIAKMRSGEISIHAAYQQAKVQVEGEPASGKSTGSVKTDNALNDMKSIMDVLKTVPKLAKQIGENVPKSAARAKAADRERLRKMLTTAKAFIGKAREDDLLGTLESAIEVAETGIA